MFTHNTMAATAKRRSGECTTAAPSLRQGTASRYKRVHIHKTIAFISKGSSLISKIDSWPSNWTKPYRILHYNSRTYRSGLGSQSFPDCCYFTTSGFQQCFFQTNRLPFIDYKKVLSWGCFPSSVRKTAVQTLRVDTDHTEAGYTQ